MKIQKTRGFKIILPFYFLFIFTFTATALFGIEDEPFIKYQFGQLENEKNYLITVSIFTDQTIQLKKDDLKSEINFTHFTKKMNSENFISLKEIASKLNHVPIKEVIDPFPCLVDILPFMLNDHLYLHSDESPLKLIDGPHDCWITKVTSPLSWSDKLQAHQLKNSLKMVALELLSIH